MDLLRDTWLSGSQGRLRERGRKYFRVPWRKIGARWVKRREVGLFSGNKSMRIYFETRLSILDFFWDGELAILAEVKDRFIGLYYSVSQIVICIQFTWWCSSNADSEPVCLGWDARYLPFYQGALKCSCCCSSSWAILKLWHVRFYLHL